MMKILVWLAVGGGLGAALGYFGQCTTGTCPLTANWKRGAMFGALLGLMFSVSSGGTAPGAANESSANVRRITAAQFEAEVLQAKGPVVVDFYADWCGPCRRLSPMLDKKAGEFSGKIKVVKVNVDKEPALAERYGIEGIPALKFFESGKEVGGIEGLPSEKVLENHLRQLVESGDKARDQAPG